MFKVLCLRTKIQYQMSENETGIHSLPEVVIKIRGLTLCKSPTRNARGTGSCEKEERDVV